MLLFVWTWIIRRKTAHRGRSSPVDTGATPYEMHLKWAALSGQGTGVQRWKPTWEPGVDDSRCAARFVEPGAAGARNFLWRISPIPSTGWKHLRYTVSCLIANLTDTSIATRTDTLGLSVIEDPATVGYTQKSRPVSPSVRKATATE